MKYIMIKDGLFLSYLTNNRPSLVSKEIHNALLVSKKTKNKLVKDGSFEVFLALKEEK